MEDGLNVRCCLADAVEASVPGSLDVFIRTGIVVVELVRCGIIWCSAEGAGIHEGCVRFGSLLPKGFVCFISE